MNIKEITDIENGINSIVDNGNFDDKFVDMYERLVPSDILNNCYNEIKESNLSEETKLLLMAQLIDYNNTYNKQIENLYKDFMYNSLLFKRSPKKYDDDAIKSDKRYGKILGLFSELQVKFENIKCISDNDFDEFLKKYLNTDLAFIKSIIISEVAVREIEEDIGESFDYNNIEYYKKNEKSVEKSVEYSFNQEDYKLENIINDTFYIKDFLEMEDK